MVEVSSVTGVGANKWQDQDPSALTDKAIERATTVFTKDILALREFMVEKVEGSVEIIKTRLDGNDTALVAALQAQKEAATKQTENFTAILDESKKGTTKQIDALNEKIDDLKERMTEAGGRSSGVSSTATLAVAVIAALTGIVSVAVVLSRPAQPTQVHLDRPAAFNKADLFNHQSNTWVWDGF
jgi:hypothetical protein